MNSIGNVEFGKPRWKQYERPEDAPHQLVLPIDRRVLLQFLMEAVEEVQT